MRSRWQRHNRRFEFNILNNVIFDLEVNFHNIAAGGVPDFTDTVGVINFTNISRVAE